MDGAACMSPREILCSLLDLVIKVDLIKTSQFTDVDASTPGTHFQSWL